MNFYIPEEIIVGFQKRYDTLTENLAFITYKKPDGKLLNEGNFNKWISKEIPYVTLKNTPTNDFVVNKNVKHGNHYSSDTKIRIYDNREMEIEIPVDNFLFVVKNSEISKGNIKQDCVYGWLNNQIYLVPINSNEYKEAMEHTNAMNEKVTEYVVGNVYQDKKQNNYIYVGTGKVATFEEDGVRSIYRSLNEQIAKINYKTKKGNIFIDKNGIVSVSITEKYNSSMPPWETLETCENILKNIENLNNIMSKSKKTIEVLNYPLKSIADNYVKILEQVEKVDQEFFNSSREDINNYNFFSKDKSYTFKNFGNSYLGEEVKIGLSLEKNNNNSYYNDVNYIAVKDNGDDNWFKNVVSEVLKNENLNIKVACIDNNVVPVNILLKLSGFYSNYKEYNLVVDIMDLLKINK